VNCAAVRDVLPELALGVAPGDDADAVELHVETCAACRKEAVDLQRAAASFAYALAGEGAMPETLEQGVVDAVHEVARPAKHPHSRGRRTGVALLVAAVLVAGVGVGSVIAGREEHLRLQAERTALAQNDTIQRFAETARALGGRDTKVLIGTLSGPAGSGVGSGTGSALTILTKGADDQVVVIVNDLAGRALPLEVSISDTKGHTIDIGRFRALDTAGGATLAREIPSSLSGFVDITIRDARGHTVLRGTLQAQTAVASPSP
jgi:predicted anti-sigma-YlaC factor YlaD